MIKTNAVGWFDIYVNDMARAVSFYETVFAIKLEEIVDPTGDTKMMSFHGDMKDYGAMGALVKSSYGRPGPGGTLLYFSVEDSSVEEARVQQAGGTVIRSKFSIGQFGFVTLCIDTEGNSFGLSSMK
jgi:predicted enzyme related to lactoylglutathione lyase